MSCGPTMCTADPWTPPSLKSSTNSNKKSATTDLWACHLGPDLGGQGYGQVKLALMHEILGGSQWASLIFGTQAPDTGNAEILAHFGTPGQKARYLKPLLEGEIVSCYSMTEPQGGVGSRGVHHDGCERR